MCTSLQDASEYQCESGEPPRYVPHKPITGVIGASFSTESIMVANILRLFKVLSLYTLNFLYYWELKQYVERVQGCQGRKLYLVTVSFHLLATCHAQPALLQHLLISIQQTIFCPAPPRLSTCSISSWQYGSCELSSVYRSLSDGESGDDGFKGSSSGKMSPPAAECTHSLTRNKLDYK